MPLNLGSFSVTIAIVGNLILGFIVFFSRKKSATSVLFLLLTISISLWSLVNFLSYQNADPATVAVLVRLVMFFAVPIGTLFLFFTYTFPHDKFAVRKEYAAVLISYSIFVMIATLTPLIFSQVNVSTGSAPEPVIAPGILMFIIIPVLAILLGILLLAKRTLQSPPDTKKQYRLFSAGASIMFGLILIFNFLLPSFFNNSRFIPFSAIFTLPFVAFTAYAIFKHHLLNLKIITTEVLTFLLVLATAAEIILSSNLPEIIFRFSIVLLVLGVGISLIRSVRKEVEQRELLERLTAQLENANGKLKALDQARSEFITIASHQLRTPPATIKWFLSSLLGGDYGPLTDDQKQALTKAERTNNSQISLIEDMLNVSRIERGKMEFLFEPADLLDLADTTCEQLLPIAQEKHLELIFEKPAFNPPQITVDKEKIRQVMNNLIDNAIKYTKSGQITVRLTFDFNELRFSVTDTGKGFGPEEKNAMFDKFSRGKESIKHSAGLGLGLYVAKVIIDQHKGKIWAESPGEGQGSTFTFAIPINNGLSATTLIDLTRQQPAITKASP